ncbi:ubiquinol-cytochrome c reductase cytochrome c subunit [Kytococcus aerolatus]|uniref:Cytochrome bc1 complex cytochrome c subunit n=1 Tax=Kytococcus aerolatus TaxID=592308 RepID=A0A212T3Y5_9MICO|nr:c-type cytochrome [Kytococcus aerolatus]SNC60738.1 ubiquinol-cytochrome c reductase cytochrome c subunit [Kytococcus aerolatus]
MNSLLEYRRHPAAVVVLLLAALATMGGLYTALKPTDVSAQSASYSEEDVKEGDKLFQANCATCHGEQGEGITEAGPSLAGVGAAAVDFQVGTGRMPLAAPNVQAARKEPQFDEEQTKQLAAFVASLGAGPTVPDAKYTDLEGADPANGGELFRVNCAMCHNFNGSGGALTRGKYAPSLEGVSPTHLYEAMETGPQNMPVFSDTNLSPQDKEDISAYLDEMHSAPNEGGNDLGNLGPVADGVFIWTIGIGIFLASAIWLTRKSS